MAVGYDISASASSSSSAPSSTGAIQFGNVLITNFGNVAGFLLLVIVAGLIWLSLKSGKKPL